MCVGARRHTPAFNSWLTSANLASFPRALNLEEESPLMQLHAKLCTLDIPIANTVTPQTRNLNPRRQKWLLIERFREILGTGGLYVSSSRGFNKESAYMVIGCASLHILCPYLTPDITPPRVDAIQRHLSNFLPMDPEARSSLAVCTAERSCPGAKHGDRTL